MKNKIKKQVKNHTMVIGIIRKETDKIHKKNLNKNRRMLKL